MGSNKPVYFVSATVGFLLFCSLCTFQYKISDLRADLEATEKQLQHLQEANPSHRSKRFVKTSHGGAADDFVGQFQTQQSESFNTRLIFVEQKLEQFVTKIVVQLKGTQGAQQSQLLKIQEKLTRIYEQLKKHEETLLELVSKSLVAEVQQAQYKKLSERITKLEELRVELSEVEEQTKTFQAFKVAIENVTADFRHKFDDLTLSLSVHSKTIEGGVKRLDGFQEEFDSVRQEITKVSAELHDTKEGIVADVKNTLEGTLSRLTNESLQNAQNFEELLTKLAGVEVTIGEHSQSLRVVEENDARVRQEIRAVQDELTSLGNNVTTYFNGNSENHEELRKTLHEVEEKVSKHAGLFKDMYAAQTEVTGVIPEVTQLSSNFTSYLAEYSTRNEYNIKIQTEVQEKLGELKVQILEQEKQLQKVHALEERADELVPKFQEKIVEILNDVTRCTKENGQNLQAQNELQKAVHEVEGKLSEYESLKVKVRDFEEFESILLKVVDLSKALYEAVCQNDSRTFQTLLKLDVNLEFRDEKGLGPLTSAIRYFRNDFVGVLLKEGANVNARDKEGKTPLHWAVGVNNVVGANLLVEKGADVNCVDVEMKSPLILAAMVGHPEVLQFLIEKGADVEQKDELSARAIHWATTMGHTECVRLLINAGVDINSESGHQTPLILAAKADQFEILQLLLEKKANVDTIDALGNTPLIVAAEKGHVQCVQALLEHGANVERKNKKQETALMIVARKGYQNILTILLDKGAQTTSVDSAGKNALFFAQKGGHTACIKILTLKGQAK